MQIKCFQVTISAPLECSSKPLLNFPLFLGSSPKENTVPS